MRVCFVFGKNEWAGSDKAGLDVLRFLLQKPEFEVVPVLPSATGPLSSHLIAHKIAFESCQLGVLSAPTGPRRTLVLGFNCVLSIFTTLWLYLRHRPQVIHLNGLVIFGALISAWLYRTFVEKNVVIIVHHRESLVKWPLVQKFLYKLVPSIADRVICVSQYLCDTMPTSVSKSIKINDPITKSPIIPIELKDTKNLLFVGRLTPIKGLHQLLKALSLLPDQYHLHICGKTWTRADKRYISNLKSWISTQHLSSRVHWKGHLTSETDIYSCVDLVIVPTLSPEPLGKVILEGILHGRPVLASGSGGVLDIYPVECRQLLFDPSSHLNIARLIQWCETNPARVTEISQLIQTHIVKEFNFSKFEQEMSCCYGY